MLSRRSPPAVALRRQARGAHRLRRPMTNLRTVRRAGWDADADGVPSASMRRADAPGSRLEGGSLWSVVSGVIRLGGRG
jgi:hypothetical protein